MGLTITYILIFAWSYLLGAIPFSYLMVKIFNGKDLRSEGSGNLGTLNSYEVSQNKLIAISVLVLDLLKAIISVAIANQLFGEHNSIGTIIAGIGIIAGHNWNIFLKFRGGRGLAPAAGLAFAINIFPLVVWLTLWTITKISFKNIHIANCLSSLISIAIIWIAPSAIIQYFDSAFYIDIASLRVLFTAVNILILLGHFNVFSQLIPTNSQRTDNDD